MLNQVSLLTAAQPVLPGLKSKTRAEHKIATELGGQAELLTDLARGSLVSNNIGSLVQSFELLNNEVTVVEVKKTALSIPPLQDIAILSC